MRADFVTFRLNGTHQERIISIGLLRKAVKALEEVTPLGKRFLSFWFLLFQLELPVS
jgi:hypothetical protein